MKNRLKAWQAAILIVILAGCTKRPYFPAYTPPPIPATVKVAIIGNSLTLHYPKADIEWNQANGMAASSSGRDYAHLFLNKIGASENQAYIRNLYPFETNSTAAQQDIQSLQGMFEKHPDITILELGDNVDIRHHPLDLIDFWRNYGDLVATAAAHSGKVYCLSTWWGSHTIDYIIRNRCEANGGASVSIGGLYAAQMEAAEPKRYANESVNKHPHDKGMEQIAERLYAATLKH